MPAPAVVLAARQLLPAPLLEKVNLPMAGTYCATKAALLSLGQALRAYLSDKCVGVITVMPSAWPSLTQMKIEDLRY